VASLKHHPSMTERSCNSYCDRWTPPRHLISLIGHLLNFLEGGFQKLPSFHSGEWRISNFDFTIKVCGSFPFPPPQARELKTPRTVAGKSLRKSCRWKWKPWGLFKMSGNAAMLSGDVNLGSMPFRACSQKHQTQQGDRARFKAEDPLPALGYGS